MNKTAGESKVRQVQAPESEIEVKHMDARRRMPATSRIPVSRTVWAELSELKKPGETFDHLLAEMIESEKKNRFFEDMDRIEKRGKFVAMEW
jgi:predicted CopG family antitoxin